MLYWPCLSQFDHSSYSLHSFSAARLSSVSLDGEREIMHPMKRRVLYFCIAAMGFINAFVFLAINAFFLGGVPSEIRNGHYYLNNHGRFKEVSRSVYLYADIHFWVTWVLILIGSLAVGRAVRLRRQL